MLRYVHEYCENDRIIESNKKIINPKKSLNEVQSVCSRSVLDTTVPGIQFDENGECQFCKVYDLMAQEYPLDETTEIRLRELVEKIKTKGKKKKYDCILGISGGTDSTYTLYKAVELGLRPLAVHFDNGWNDELAVANIEVIVKKLRFPLHTFVMNWPIAFPK